MNVMINGVKYTPMLSNDEPTSADIVLKTVLNQGKIWPGELVRIVRQEVEHIDSRAALELLNVFERLEIIKKDSDGMIFIAKKFRS